MHIFSANGAGCFNKIESIADNINHINPGIITLQETHLNKREDSIKSSVNSNFLKPLGIK